MRPLTQRKPRHYSGAGNHSPPPLPQRPSGGGQLWPARSRLPKTHNDSQRRRAEALDAIVRELHTTATCEEP
jgi:hypothetical protein